MNFIGFKSNQTFGIYSLIICLGCAAILQGETKITGRIINSITQKPIPDCNIINKNSEYGSISDSTGHFTVQAKTGDNVIFSHIAYQIKTITVNKPASHLHIILYPAVRTMNGVTINGYAQKSQKITNISSQEVEQLTNVTKDPMRSVLLLPGVSNNNSSTAEYNVRGGSFDENMVLINGSRTYKPYHLSNIAASASVSVFNYKMVDNIQFLAGGFPAEYGDVLSSVMDIEYRTGRDEFSAMCKLGMIDGNFMLEGPIGDNLSYVTTFRKSYFDYVSLFFDDKLLDNLGFYDLQGALNWKINRNNDLTCTFLHSQDRVQPFHERDTYQWTNFFQGGQIEEHNKEFNYNDFDARTGVDFLSLNWDYQKDKLKLKNIVSYYEESNNYNENYRWNVQADFPAYPKWVNNYSEVTKDSTEYDFRTIDYKLSGSYFLSNTLQILAGGSFSLVNFNNYQYHYNQYNREYYFGGSQDTIFRTYSPAAENDTISFSNDSYKSSAYVKFKKMLTEKFHIDAGLRLDYFSYNENFDISPRLLFKYNLNPGLSISGATGFYTQTPYFPSMKEDNFTDSKAKIDNQEAIHYILGLEKKLGKNSVLKIEPYYKNYLHIYPVDLSKAGELVYGSSEAYEGFARGIDFLFSTEYKRMKISLSYELGESKMIYEDEAGKEHKLSRYTDQRHTLSSLLNFKIGQGWALSLKNYYGSGYAYTPYHIVESENGNEVWRRKDKFWHTAHYPYSFRSDLLVTKEFNVANEHRMKVYLEIMNIFSNKNVLSYSHYYGGNGPYKETNHDPFDFVLPTLGISFEY